MSRWCQLPAGPHTGHNSTIGGKLGSKRHLTYRQDIPLMFSVIETNRLDSVVFEELVDALPAVGGKPGRPRRWPGRLHVDKGYDFTHLQVLMRPTQACCLTQATYLFTQACRNSLLPAPMLPASSNKPSLAWINASGWPSVGTSR